MDDIHLDYSVASTAQLEIREDLRAAHRLVLDHFRKPGRWFSGRQRLAIAEEARRSLTCALCQQRKQSLSPEHAQGEHATVSGLDAVLVDVIHRVRTDPGRLSKRWFEAVRAAGLSEGEYVEAVGIVALTAGLDAFCHTLGMPPFSLPQASPGPPSGQRPAGLTSGIAWVDLLEPENASGEEADLYEGAGFVPNIMRALSSVPEHVRVLRPWSDANYVALSDMTARRAIDRQQIELVAARVSALNGCFY